MKNNTKKKSLKLAKQWCNELNKKYDGKVHVNDFLSGFERGFDACLELLDGNKDAFKEWLKSEQGQKCSDISSLPNTGKRSSEYLQNLLWHAFRAGEESVKSAILSQE